MPLYEYYCESCNGVFEELRSMREASEPSPCPLCDRDSQRIMPTSFSAFTFRDGLPRRIPDKGTYWHINKEVKTMNTGGVPANEHPELYRPDPPKTLTKGETEDQRDVERIRARNLERLKRESDIGAPIGPDGKPSAPLNL
jgi:putative FmdB family regulatory protein